MLPVRAVPHLQVGTETTKNGALLRSLILLLGRHLCYVQVLLLRAFFSAQIGLRASKSVQLTAYTEWICTNITHYVELLSRKIFRVRVDSHFGFCRFNSPSPFRAQWFAQLSLDRLAKASIQSAICGNSVVPKHPLDATVARIADTALIHISWPLLDNERP